MSEEPSFTSAEELFAALSVPDAVARRRVLYWVATHPAEAIALGSVDGRDVLDVLFGLINRDWAYGAWEDVAITIGAFDSPRVTEFFVDLLATSESSSQAHDSVSALARRRGAEGLRERVLEIVTRDGPPERLAAAAQFLAEEPELPVEAAVRVSLLEDGVEAPRIAERTSALWLRELSGPFGEQARDELELQGPEAVRVVSERWEELSNDDRGWLLEWATEAIPGDALTSRLVLNGLESGGEELAVTAFECAAQLPEGAIDPNRLAGWLDHDSADVRAAAIAAGAPADVDLLLSQAEVEPEVLVAAVGRLGARGGDAAAEAIAPHLESESLEVRNAARDELVSLGAPAIERLRPLVHSGSRETRAAAVRALLDLGDDDWLAQELLERDG